jgi:hypothetical protein
MDELQGNIDGKTFETNYTRAIASILDNTPDTHLFATGYPRFWNDETDYCDTVSFAFGCLTNSIVPLIKARRKRMNQLTFRLNDRIKSIIAEFPKKGSPITFVDTDSYFKDHRFCEEGVKEPSYRNRNIWFFPFEYWAPDKMPVTATKQTPSGDCKAILDIGGDAGSYFTCELTKSVATGTQIDLKDQPNNVKSDDEPPIPDASALPIFLSRIFHPTPDGHKAYQEAFFSAYKAYKDDKAPNSGHKSGVKCRGLQDNSYFTRATISDLITNTYCPKLAGMSETIGSGFYLPHTPEEVEIYAAPSWNSAKGMTTPEQCSKNLHKILDECDTDSSSNPMGWKAGGEVDADGWTYSITAKGVRPPAPKRPSAWCQFEKSNAKTGCTQTVGRRLAELRLWPRVARGFRETASRLGHACNSGGSGQTCGHRRQLMGRNVQLRGCGQARVDGHLRCGYSAEAELPGYRATEDEDHCERQGSELSGCGQLCLCGMRVAHYFLAWSVTFALQFRCF